MKRVMRIEGLECPVCAGKIEKGINALEGVKSAQVNFLTSKVTIEAEDARMDDIIEETRKIAKKVEPSAVLK